MKKILLLLSVAFNILNLNAQVTYCPLDMTSINGFPVFFSTPSHDVMWTNIRAQSGNCSLYAVTTDAGASFTLDTIPDPNRSINVIYAINKDTAWAGLTDLAGSSGGAIWKTTDGGTHWTKQTTTEYSSSVAYLDVICFFTPDTGFVLGDPVGGNYEIYTTTNGGTTWTAVPPTNIPAPLSGEFALESSFSRIDNKVWCGTNKGRVLYTGDRGQTWAVSTVVAGSSFIDVKMNDPSNGVAMPLEGNTVYYTTNGGVNWTARLLSPAMNVCGLSAIKNVPGTYVFKGNGIYATDDNFVSYSLIDNSHLTLHNDLMMFDATIGWTQTGYLNFDSAIIKIANVPFGFFSPEANRHQLGIFPNPVTENAALVSLTLDKDSEIMFSLYDVAGKCMLQQQRNGIKGKNAMVFDFGSLAEGLYLLTVTDGTRRSNLKVIVN
jgi:photosystem II stability/assembly factor-like uncharacterized protein